VNDQRNVGDASGQEDKTILLVHDGGNDQPATPTESTTAI